ncbi:hypothetical protein ACFFMN_05235 [Planobispora siamensis]|uniref:Uncharacterized protein n=1 Tax=Planobispora siamensis TaxID=936338 RepID=A0A8J3SSA0_9ACTN|nr:hypothetical protein [Planobispora siamensis]GIH97932.1 hypothetical protein Psi01_85620 [Planobispora siamensis]
MIDAIRAHPAEVITSVESFAAAGITDKPVGAHIEFASGAQLLVQMVGTAPSGGRAAAEQIVEGPAPDPLPPVPLVADGERIRLADVQAWLIATLTNAGNTEIATITATTGQAHRYGISVRCHSGATCVAYFLAGLRPGQRLGAHADYQVPDVI